LDYNGMTQNAIAGRNAAQFNAAEQDNITRRIVALRVFPVRASSFHFPSLRHV